MKSWGLPASRRRVAEPWAHGIPKHPFVGDLGVLVSAELKWVDHVRHLTYKANTSFSSIQGLTFRESAVHVQNVLVIRSLHSLVSLTSFQHV